MGLTGRSAAKRRSRQQAAYLMAQRQLRQESVFNREKAWFDRAYKNSKSYADRLRQQGKVEEADDYLEKMSFVKEHFQTDLSKLPQYGGSVWSGKEGRDEYARLQSQLEGLNSRYQDPFYDASPEGSSAPSRWGESGDWAAAQEWEDKYGAGNSYRDKYGGNVASARADIAKQQAKVRERLEFLDKYGPVRVDPANPDAYDTAGSQYKLLAEIGYGGNARLDGAEWQKIAHAAQKYRTQRYGEVYGGRPEAGLALKLLGTGRSRGGSQIKADPLSSLAQSGNIVAGELGASQQKTKKPLDLQVPGNTSGGFSLG